MGDRLPARPVLRPGWAFELHTFDFTAAEPIRQLTPVMATSESGDFVASSLGAVTAAVVPVDVNLTPQQANTSGCDHGGLRSGRPLTPDPGGVGDFAGFPAGRDRIAPTG